MAEAEMIEEESDKGRIPVRRLIGLARPELVWLALGTLCLVVAGSAMLVYPQAIRMIIDGAVEHGMTAVNRAAFIMLVVFVIQGIAVAARFYLFTTAGERIVALQAPPGYFIIRSRNWADRRRIGSSRSGFDQLPIHHCLIISDIEPSSMSRLNSALYRLSSSVSSIRIVQTTTVSHLTLEHVFRFGHLSSFPILTFSP